MPPPEVAAAYRAAGHWRDRTVGEYLDWRVRECPQAVAVVDGPSRVTYAELGAQVDRLAEFLVRRGVERGDVVSFQLPNGLPAMVAFHATLKLGAVSNPIVPIYRGHELRHILGQARSKVAVIAAGFRGFDYLELYRQLRGRLPELEAVVVVGNGALEDGEWRWEDLVSGGERPEPQAPTPSATDPDDVSLLLYTSGTTAVPKGALHSHNTLLFEAHLMADWARLDERDVTLCSSPVTHATGILNGLLAPVVSGGRVVMQDVWRPDVALDLIERERVTYTMFATPFLRGLVSEVEARQADPSSLRRIGCGGAEIPAELMRTANERLCSGTVRVYGASEGFTVTSTTSWDPFEKRVETDGRWLAGYEGAILTEDGEELPDGVAGELCWGGAGMFLGFLDPALNEAAFTAEGYYRSGDLAVLDRDGYLTITGRIKDIINRSGEKISAYEVEQLLAEHPAVREVAVVAQPDPVTGERGCAWVVLDAGSELSLADLAEFLIGREVAKQKIPEDLAFLDELPKTAAGKIRKDLLRERARRRVAPERSPAPLPSGVSK